MSIIANFKGTYWISDSGRVFNSNFHNTGEWRELKYDYSRNGYKTVTICIDGKTERFMVHRKVAELFVPNPDPENLTCIDHYNDDRTDERAVNLHWVSIAQNNQKDSKRERLRKSLKGHKHTEEAKLKMSRSQMGRERCSNGKVKGKPVEEIDEKGNRKVWDSCKAAAEFYGFHSDTIAKCARGDRATAINGKKWKYV